MPKEAGLKKKKKEQLKRHKGPQVVEETNTIQLVQAKGDQKPELLKCTI